MIDVLADGTRRLMEYRSVTKFTQIRQEHLVTSLEELPPNSKQS